MVLKNKLGINNELELAKAEEKITKSKAVELFESGRIKRKEMMSNLGQNYWKNIYKRKKAKNGKISINRRK